VIHRIVVAVFLLAVALGVTAVVWRTADDATRTAQARRTALLIPPDAAVMETDHYRIHHTATLQQAEMVGTAVEKLYAAYTSVFSRANVAASDKLILILYKDQIEFRKNNRSSPWAEAYYIKPACYAYFDAQAENPYHWMLHEATHQLARQVSGFRRNRWIDEGLASYFATSRIAADGMQLGTLDAKAYPIWWVGHFQLTGDAARDAVGNRFIPLPVLLTGIGGPNVDAKFNLYYVNAWSFTHFMFHYENGKYAQAYAQFLARGASLDDFTALIGPVSKIQAEWYPYLVEQVRSQPMPFPLFPAN
jgi:hypothetical protein